MWKLSRSESSSRSLALKLSTLPFSSSQPGSMLRVSAPTRPSQPLTAQAVGVGPSSEQTCWSALFLYQLIVSSTPQSTSAVYRQTTSLTMLVARCSQRGNLPSSNVSRFPPVSVVGGPVNRVVSPSQGKSSTSHGEGCWRYSISSM